MLQQSGSDVKCGIHHDHGLVCAKNSTL